MIYYGCMMLSTSKLYHNWLNDVAIVTWFTYSCMMLSTSKLYHNWLYDIAIVTWFKNGV